MKTKILMGGLLTIILTMFIACNQEKKDAAPDNDMIKAEIQALEALKFENFVSINAQRNSKLES